MCKILELIILGISTYTMLQIFKKIKEVLTNE